MTEIIDVFKVFAPSTVAFCLGILITPIISHYLYKYKFWKKTSGKVDLDGNETPVYDKLYKKRDIGTPRMGGLVIWVSATLTILLFWIFSITTDNVLADKLNFLSRNQTWLPLFTLLLGSLVGLVDDYMQVTGINDQVSGGLSFYKRLLVVILMGLIGGLWFFYKLDVSAIHIPFWGPLELGFLFIPFFILVMIALFGSGVIDGLDGLSGGVMSIIFGTYAGIAFFQNQIDLAAFSAVIAGSTLAFLWFNIPPARFYMSETGILGLTSTLTVVAFLTDSVVMLPIIAFPLTLTVLVNIIQLTSKKFLGKKVFLAAPLHHHFEAIGWPASKIVMRYWVIGVIVAIFGMIITLIGR